MWIHCFGLCACIGFCEVTNVFVHYCDGCAGLVRSDEMARITDAEFLVMQLRHALKTWRDLQAALRTSREASVYLQMKRGELGNRFWSIINAPKGKGKKKAKGTGAPNTTNAWGGGAQQLPARGVGCLGDDDSPPSCSDGGGGGTPKGDCCSSEAPLGGALVHRGQRAIRRIWSWRRR